MFVAAIRLNHMHLEQIQCNLHERETEHVECLTRLQLIAAIMVSRVFLPSIGRVYTIFHDLYYPLYGHFDIRQIWSAAQEYLKVALHTNRFHTSRSRHTKRSCECPVFSVIQWIWLLDGDSLMKKLVVFFPRRLTSLCIRLLSPWPCFFHLTLTFVFQTTMKLNHDIRWVGPPQPLHWF